MAGPLEQRFEQYLVEHGFITEDELQAAHRLLARAQAEGQPLTLAAALVRSGVLTETQARRALASLKGETTSLVPTIPGVQLLGRIGRGSQAVVFRGRQLSVDRTVAVKVLLSKQAADPVLKQRFLREARAAAQLAHNNIVQAIDAGETAEGQPYFIMEIVDPPRTVADLVSEARGPLDEAEALRITLQIARALAHAHSRGLIHRDVKPKNIMITSEGVAKLADMGLARMTDDAGLDDVGKAYGTPYYIAPEQVLGSPDVDFRADLYSLGATFYEMLTGRPPFAGATPQQIMQKHVNTTLTPPDHINAALSAGVSEVVEVMMSKRPRDRYRSTEDLLVDLEDVAAGRPPRLARERAGLGSTLMEGLTEGDSVGPEPAAADPADPGPFAFNLLAVVLVAALAVTLLMVILLAALR